MSYRQNYRNGGHDGYRSGRRSPPYSRDNRDRDRHDGGGSYRRDGGYRSRDRDRDRDRDWNGPRRRDDQRRRSRSPPIKRRLKETLAELEDVIPINERKRADSRWDLKPVGYENVSIEVAKLSGIFPSPGNPRPALDKLRAILNNDKDKITETIGANNLLTAANFVSLKPETSKGARTVLLRLPENLNADENTLKDVRAGLMDYYNYLNVKHEIPKPAVKGITLTDDPRVLAIEFSSNEVATLSLVLDSSKLFSATGAYSFERQSSYIVPNAAAEGGDSSQKDAVSSRVPDSPSKIAVSNIPDYLEEEQVMELLKAFGDLKSFTLIRDKDNFSKGIALADFVDSSTSAMVCQGLDGTQVGENNLSVKLTCVGLQQASKISSTYIDKMLALENNKLTDTKVLQLFNLITWDNMSHGQFLDDVKEEVEQECIRITGSNDVTVRIPTTDSKESFGPRVFVEFDNVSACKTALTHLGGRKFWERTVIAALYAEQNFDLGLFI